MKLQLRTVRFRSIDKSNLEKLSIKTSNYLFYYCHDLSTRFKLYPVRSSLNGYLLKYFINIILLKHIAKGNSYLCKLD